MRVVVDNRVRIPESDLAEEVREALKERFDHSNPAYWRLVKSGRRAWSQPKTIKTWKVDPEGNLTFPRGGWSVVKEVLAVCGVTGVTVSDHRQRGLAAPKLTHFVEDRDYQQEAISAALERENCIVRASTGSGKTSIGLGFAARVETSAIVLVDSEAIAKEWLRRAREELNVEPGFVGKGKRDVRAFTVALHQTLTAMGAEQLAELHRRFGCVIADELQVCGAPTFFANVDGFPARYRLGLSDDHHRADGKTFLVTDLFGKVAYKIGDKALLARGAIADVDVLVDPTEFEAPWYSDRYVDGEDVTPPTEADFTELVTQMTFDDDRSSKIAIRIAGEVARGQSFLVGAHRVEHCERLKKLLVASGVPTGLMLGGHPEFESTRAGLLSGVVKVGVGTKQALGKGVNVPSVDASYAATPMTLSVQTWRQWKGRVIRPKAGGAAARAWVAWDGRVFGDAPVRKLLRWHPGRVRVAVGSRLISPAEYRSEKGNSDDSAKSEEDRRRAAGG